MERSRRSRKRKQNSKTAVVLIVVLLIILGAAAAVFLQPWKEEEITVVVSTTAETTSAQATTAAPVTEAVTETTPMETTTPVETAPSYPTSKNGYRDGGSVLLDPAWKYADFSEIHEGSAVMYLAAENRKDIIVGVNAGHGTKGGSEKSTYSHPDKTGKVTGGTNAYGAVMSMCVSPGMTFDDGTPESAITLREAQILKEMLLADGYDVLMIRDGEDVQLDNVARTVICNNAADCHIAVHWDSDGLDYDKGVFYCAVPDPLKKTEPVASVWEKSEELGECLLLGLAGQKVKKFVKGTMDLDLTQTAYSTIPSVDMELGNQSSKTDDETLTTLAAGLLSGINAYFGFNAGEGETQ